MHLSLCVCFLDRAPAGVAQDESLTVLCIPLHLSSDALASIAMVEIVHPSLADLEVEFELGVRTKYVGCDCNG